MTAMLIWLGAGVLVFLGWLARGREVHRMEEELNLYRIDNDALKQTLGEILDAQPQLLRRTSAWMRAQAAGIERQSKESA
jgi:hypothetical protein